MSLLAYVFCASAVSFTMRILIFSVLFFQKERSVKNAARHIVSVFLCCVLQITQSDETVDDSDNDYSLSVVSTSTFSIIWNADSDDNNDDDDDKSAINENGVDSSHERSCAVSESSDGGAVISDDV
ncbi:predicted protein [Uncinocarpus reesii 1704]|uniref:Uncharacterized protein n=1 Tax=Uncinocarpus reesii (strain UAMH 1704) TaxID=336963 RepID=C4JKU2_UNCRE|nr:uncharacterized protein UREG_00157 [Uncinocarpus reesii 1704]EEP75311.1 predicted protein [Uncinocarpus reesii 1704]